MSEVILGHRLTKNTNGKTVFMVFHPNENTVEVDALYDYVINAGYPVLTNTLIAEWSLKGLTTNEVKDIGWAISAPKRVSWITIVIGTELVTYISTDKDMEDFFNVYITDVNFSKANPLVAIKNSNIQPNKRKRK